MTARLVGRSAGTPSGAISEEVDFISPRNLSRMPTIAQQNDALRRHGAGEVFVTAGIAALPVEDRAAIIDRVRSFDEFSPKNDPYGEHDFGSFDHQGLRIFWKIDAYDQDLKFGSPDPADPAVTRRVLTIMLAEEY